MNNYFKNYQSAVNSLCHSFKDSNVNAYISPLISDDIAALKIIGIDPSIWRFARFPKNTSEVFEQYFEKVLKKEDSLLFTVRCSSTDKIIGFTRLRSVDFTVKNAEIGTWLVKERQGRGLNFFIKNQLLQIAFNILKLKEIYCYVSQENNPSVKSLLALGFLINTEKQRLSPTHNINIEIPQYYIYITREIFNMK